MSDACDIGGEEVDAVLVEGAAGAAVMLGGARVGVAGQDLRVTEGTPASRALVIAACRRECGLMCLGMPAVLAMRVIGVEAYRAAVDSVLAFSDV
jgi:hypothetical protein